MSDSQQSQTTDRLLDGAIFMAIAAFGLLIHPIALAAAACVVAGIVLALRARYLRDLIRAMGPAGWITLIFGCFVFGSAAWSLTPVFAIESSLPIFLAVVLGMPAVFVIGLSGPGSAPNWMAILLICIVAGLIVFEAASGGMVRRAVPGGTGLFVLIVAFLSIAVWPVAALIHLRFGWMEALIWVAASMIAIGFSGFTNFMGAAFIGLVFFGLGHLSSLLARGLLIFGIIFGGIGFAVAATLFADMASALPADLIQLVTAWREALSSWAETPIHGTGAGSSVAAMASMPGQNVFLQLLIGTGGAGLVLGILAACLIVIRAVRPEEGTWRGAAASGLCGSVLAMAFVGPGLWQPWWVGALVVSAISLAACRPVEGTSNGSLGSIFDAARDAEEEDAQREEDGLYHFDDEYDDEFDEDDEWEIDDSRVDDDDRAR